MAAITKAVNYKPRAKGPGLSGILQMNEEKVIFVPDDPRSSAELNVGFKDIKGHKFSKEETGQALLNLTLENGGYIFEFNDFADRDDCRDFIAEILRGR